MCIRDRDYYGSMGELKFAFKRFALMTQFMIFANADDKNTMDVMYTLDRRVRTFAIDNHADYRAVNINEYKPCLLYTSQEVPVQSVSLSAVTMTLNEGESKTLTATVLPANATDRAVVWSVLPTGFATVANLSLIHISLPMYSFSFWGWYCVAIPTVSISELTQLDSGKSTMRYLSLIHI